MRALRQIPLMAVLAVFLVQLPEASALSIVTVFVGGAAPSNAAGAGNLVDIVNTAARIWESAYSDQSTVYIYFGWAPTAEAGTHTLIEQGGLPNREITGNIYFNNTGAVRFYLDATPEENEEYQRRTDEYQDLGNGFLNVARIFSSPVGDAAGSTDLLSVAVHEMGHAMGMSLTNSAFIEQSRPGTITISNSLPYAGTVVPLASNKAGVTSHLDALRITYGAIMAGIGSDERRIPSDLDILTNAQISGFQLAGPQQSTSTSRAPARRR